MTREEKLERLKRKKIAQRRRKIKRRRRAYALLLICIFVGMAIIFYKAGAKSGQQSVSGNEMPAVGAASDIYKGTTDEDAASQYSLDEYSGVGSVDNSVSGNSFYNPTANMKLDVSTGVANVDLNIVKESGGDVLNSAKDAMINRAYFTGCSNSVNNILTLYAPDGKWHAIKTTGSEVCVFYTGHHEHDVFKVTFLMYNDGSFYLQGVSINNELISDPVVYIEEIL